MKLSTGLGMMYVLHMAPRAVVSRIMAIRMRRVDRRGRCFFRRSPAGRPVTAPMARGKTMTTGIR